LSPWEGEAGEAPAEAKLVRKSRLGRSLALPERHALKYCEPQRWPDVPPWGSTFPNLPQSLSPNRVYFFPCLPGCLALVELATVEVALGWLVPAWFLWCFACLPAVVVG